MVTKRSKKKAAWSRGVLYWKLHETQLEIYWAIKGTKGKRFVLNCSRRLGKTFLLVIIALETCLRKRNARVRFAAPTGDALEEIVLPIFDEVLKDCPRKLRPEYRPSKKKYVFSNGSEIKLAGVDKGNHNRLRGPRSDLNLVDEAGFTDCLVTLDKDVLMPQLMYSENGITVISSTPSDTPDHPFRSYCDEADEKGYYLEKTIWDNPRLTLLEILEFAEEAGCEVDWVNKVITKESTTWKREYLCQHVTESERAIIPEFTKDRQERVVMPWPRPEYCHKWTFVDTGFIDFTGVLFCYYDFIKAKVVFEDELLINFKEEGMTTRLLAERIFAKEKELWGDDEPYARFGDGDLIVLNELTSEHGLTINQVAKDHLEAQVNQARIDILQERTVITPNCVKTRAHIQNAIWNKQRTKFDRSSTDGHYDLLATFIYALRHVNRDANPWPALLRVDRFNSYIPGDIEEETTERELKSIFSR